MSTSQISAVVPIRATDRHLTRRPHVGLHKQLLSTLPIPIVRNDDPTKPNLWVRQLGSLSFTEKGDGSAEGVVLLHEFESFDGSDASDARKIVTS